MCLCVGDLGSDLGISPSTVSHHVKALAEAGLIRTERCGQSILCYIDPDVREAIARYVASRPAVPADALRDAVREAYAEVARGGAGGSDGCGCGCGSGPGKAARGGAASPSTAWGYGTDELAAVPDGADLGLGCGNPTAIASLSPGETVLDLGSGGGLDCFLAASRVGETGHVIGVDMTPDMISRARANARRSGATNVEFRLGEIENIPASDGSIDVLISNCVINLSPDKKRVYDECFRVLRPGGRIAFSDIVAVGPIPEAARRDLGLWSGCASGALPIAEIERLLTAAGFEDVRVTVRKAGHEVVTALAEESELARLIASATIEGRRPAPQGNSARSASRTA